MQAFYSFEPGFCSNVQLFLRRTLVLSVLQAAENLYWQETCKKKLCNTFKQGFMVLSKKILDCAVYTHKKLLPNQLNN